MAAATPPSSWRRPKVRRGGMERPEEPPEDQDEEECCNVPLCSSYMLGLMACLLIVGGVCLAFHRWDSLWLLLAGVGVVLIFLGTLLHFCSQSSRRRQRRKRRRRSERHLQEHLLPTALPLNNAYSVSQLSLNMLPTYFQGVQGNGTPDNKETFSQILHIKGQSFLLLPITSTPSSPQNPRWSTHLTPTTPDSSFPTGKDQGDASSRPMLMLTQKDLTPGLKEEGPKPANNNPALVDQGAQTSDPPSANVSLSLSVAELPQQSNEAGNTHTVAVQITPPTEEENCACTRCKTTVEVPVPPQIPSTSEEVVTESIYDSLPRRTDNPSIAEPPAPEVLLNVPEPTPTEEEEEQSRTDCDDLIPDACSPPPSYEEVTTGATAATPPPSFTAAGYGTI